MFGQELLELDPEEKGLQNEGDNDGHDNHGEYVKSHEKGAAILLARDVSIALHYDEPVVDYGELEQGHSRDGQAGEVVQVEECVAVRVLLVLEILLYAASTTERKDSITFILKHRRGKGTYLQQFFKSPL